MYHQHPDRTKAIILSGKGYSTDKSNFQRRIDTYRANGIGFRWRYTFEDLSPAFRATPLAHFFANLFTERNEFADVDTICHQFGALQEQEPEGHYSGIGCPVIILTGSEDNAHPTLVRPAGTNTGLRVESIARRRARLPDRAALAVRPLHDRVPYQARPFPGEARTLGWILIGRTIRQRPLQKFGTIETEDTSWRTMLKDRSTTSAWAAPGR